MRSNPWKPIKPYITEFVKQFIWMNGYLESGYYKEVDFKKPVKVQVFRKPYDNDPGEFITVFATGMFVETDIGACGHKCEEPFVLYDPSEGDELGIPCPMSDVGEEFHDALLTALVNAKK